MTLQECVNDLVMRGCDDWLDASEVASVAIQVGRARTADQVRDLSLGVIPAAVQQGLMEVGDLPEQGRRLRLWPMTPPECLERIEREWNALGRNPTLSEICW